MYDLRSARAEIETLTERMGRVLDVPGIPYAVQRACSDGAGCVNVVRAAHRGALQAARDTPRAVWLIFDGELYNADELRFPRGPLAADDDAAALCLALYLSEGVRFVHRLNGQFNIVLFHEIDRTLVLVTDRHGYRPLFLAHSGSRLLFASEMKAVIAVLDTRPRVDGVGIFSLMFAGRLFGDRTWIEPIRVADPGTIVQLSAHGVSTQRYYRLRFRPVPQGFSLNESVERFGTALTRAARRVAAGSDRIGVPLSGGLDSRSALLALGRGPGHVVAYTFGDPASRDARYAHQLAACTRVPHLNLAYQPGYLDHVLSPIVWRTEGLVPYATTQYGSLHFHHQISAETDVLLYGHCGDALTGAHLQPGYFLARSREQLIRRIYRGLAECSDAALQHTFNPGFYRRYVVEAFDLVRSTFADLDQDAPADVADSWDMEQRQRRGTFHSTTLDRYRFGVRTPFLDKDLVEHLVQTPARWRFEQIAYKRMIVRTFPWAARVPWAYTGHRIRGHRVTDLAALGWNYLHTRVRSSCTRSLGNHARLPGDQFRNLATELRAAPAVAAAIRAFTRESYFPDDVFDRRGIDDIVRRHWEAGENHTHLVTMLATLATAWRLFLWEQPLAMPSEAQPP